MYQKFRKLLRLKWLRETFKPLNLELIEEAKAGSEYKAETYHIKS